MRNTQLPPLLIALLLSFPVLGQSFSVEEVNYSNGDITLYADIFSPRHPRGKTGITLVQGSGNSDRSNLWSRAFADILAENGFYVLLPDKRGCGKSEGDWKHASFQDLATDVTASVEYLKRKLDLQKVGVMGLSQGGFIAPIAASRDPEIHFVIAISGATVTLEQQIIHEMANTARKEGLNPNEVKEVLDLHVLIRQYALDRDWEPLEKRYSELQSSSWAAFASTFPDQSDSWIWDWIQLNINFDPMDYWTQLSQDVMVVYGSKDQDDNVPVYESIYRLQKQFHANGKENYQLNVYESGHTLYEDDKAELREEFINDLLEWVGRL